MRTGINTGTLNPINPAPLINLPPELCYWLKILAQQDLTNQEQTSCFNQEKNQNQW